MIIDQMVTHELLTPLAQAAMNSPNLRINDWHRTTLSVQGRRTIFRFAGMGYNGTAPQPWSLILKEIEAPERDDAPDLELDCWFYWQRESLLYAAGIPQTLNGDLRAPRCFGAMEPLPHLRWIWLEDLQDCYVGKWPLDRYGLAAYHLGKFNGRYLAGQPMPVAPWLHDHGLRSASGAQVMDNAMVRLRDPAIWDHSLLRSAFSQPMLPALERLAADRERFLAGAAEMPRTFCHLDAHSDNMAALVNDTGKEVTVLFDWALAGYGVLGEEISRLVWAALLDCKVEVAEAEPLEAMVFERYLQGLNDVGWRADPLQVRYGYLMSSVLIFPFEMEAVEFAFAEDVAEMECVWGWPQERLIAQNAQVNDLLLARADELRRMLSML
ncbi:MAG: phosphotransferase [Caldilineaceae bacterium]